MDFFVPYDQLGVANPGPWQNASPASGQRGSILNALVFPAIQGEILNVQDAAGLARNAGDFTQLLQAIKYLISTAAPSAALVHSGSDTSTTANTVTATVSPAITAYAQGQRHEIKLANSITGAGAVANICGLGNRTITRADGTPTQANDGVAGQVLDLVDDGIHLQIVGLRTSFLPSSSAVEFTASTNWTVPAGVTVIKSVRVWAPGGGGGGSSGSGGAGAGGGGGGYAESLNVAVVPGSIIPVIIGAPGVGGNTAASAGTAGGTTSFGSANPVTATGGGGGFGGAGTLTGPNGGGAGGVGFGNTLSASGAPGGGSFSISGGVASGTGGASTFGGGSPSLNITGAGNPGNFPGGGANSGSAGSGGGTGGAGVIVIQY